jgi:hypothetical protein
MKYLLRTLATLLAFVAIAGCGPNARYCANCETAASQKAGDERPQLIRGRCTVNGVEIDCTYEHASCPECRDKK